MSLLFINDRNSKVATISRRAPTPLAPAHWARNGRATDPGLPNAQAQAVGWLAMHSGREVFSHASPVRDSVWQSNYTFERRAYCKTGPATRFLRFICLLGMDHSVNAPAGTSPLLRFTATPQGLTNALITTTEIQHGTFSGSDPGEYPGSWSHRDVWLSVYPDTEYEITVDGFESGVSNTCKVIGMTCVECGFRDQGAERARLDYGQHQFANPQDEAGWPLSEPAQADSPVLAVDRWRIGDIANKLWKRGTLLFCTDAKTDDDIHPQGIRLTDALTNRGRESNQFLNLRLRFYGRGAVAGGTVTVYSEKGDAAGGIPLIQLTGVGTTDAWYTTTAVEHGGALSAGNWGRLRLEMFHGGGGELGATGGMATILTIEDS